MRRFTFLSVLAVVVLGLSAISLAQSDTARIVGTVTDGSGAALPGATITVKSTTTARTLSVQTGATGNYVVSTLIPGTYHVEVKMANFKTSTADITLEVSQVQEISFKLQPGAVETMVNVTDEVPLVDTSTSSTGEVIQGRQVTELPLNGRNFTQLALLTPGVTRGAYGNNASGGGNSNPTETSRYADSGGAGLAVNGLRPQANNFILDGVDNNESLVNTIVFFPPAEAIQEFRVNTTVAPAEFGRAGGAVVQATIKSGTNQIHGTVFDYLRNNYFDALSYGETKSVPLHRNQFGVTLGGPIWKNKLFLFFDYQGLRQKQPDVVETITVPTAKERIGDFTELLGNARAHLPVAAACPGIPASFANKGYIWNPVTCTPFGWIGDLTTGSAGPNINIVTNPNPVALKYLQAFPLPIPGAGLFDNYKEQRLRSLTYNDIDARMDFNLSSTEALFARFSWGQDDYEETSRLPNLPAGPGSGSNPTHPRGLAIGYTRTITSNLVNELRFGYNRPFYAYVQPYAGVSLSNALGIPVPNAPGLLGGGTLIGGNGGGGEAIEYTGDFGSYSVPQHSYQFLETLSWNKGNHAFKFGGNIIKRGVDFFQGNRGKGYFQLGGQDYIGAGQYTGFEVSEMLAGFVDYQIGNSNAYYRTSNWETGYFAQDDFRVNKKLTLNLGVRYDLYTWPTEQNNHQSNFDLTTGALIEPGAKGWNKSLINTDRTNFAPRVGFAYDLSGNSKTVIRGGYGMFYFLDRGGVGNQLSNNAEFNGYTQYSARNGYRITLQGACPQSATGYTGNVDWTQCTNPLPFANLNINLNNPVGAGVIAYPKNSKNSNVQQWNIQVSRQLTQNMSLDVAYVGTHMGNLATVFNANSNPFGGGAQAYPGVANVTEYAHIGSGHYNSLQVHLNRRFTKGLQYTASYTYAHTHDNSNGAFDTTGGSGGIFILPGGKPDLALNEGNSDSDLRHAFTFSSLYELPFGKGQKYASDAPKALDLIIGGWQWNNVLTLQTGTPFNYTIGGTPNARPDLVSYKLGGGNHTVVTAVLKAPPGNGTWTRNGNLARNFFYGPGFHSWDGSFFKNFRITERVNTQFRWEVFNILNTPQYTNPNNVSGSVPQDGTTGTVTWRSTQTRLNSERQMQFALKVSF